MFDRNEQIYKILFSTNINFPASGNPYSIDSYTPHAYKSQLRRFGGDRGGGYALNIRHGTGKWKAF